MCSQSSPWCACIRAVTSRIAGQTDRRLPVITIVGKKYPDCIASPFCGQKYPFTRFIVRRDVKREKFNVSRSENSFCTIVMGVSVSREDLEHVPTSGAALSAGPRHGALAEHSPTRFETPLGPWHHYRDILKHPWRFDFDKFFRVRGPGGPACVDAQRGVSAASRRTLRRGAYSTRYLQTREKEVSQRFSTRRSKLAKGIL